VIAFFAAAGSYLLLAWLLSVINRHWGPGMWIADLAGYILFILSHLGFGVVLFPLWVWFWYWVAKKII
jgi:hypothetical protein